MLDVLEECGVDSRRQGELLRTLGVDRILLALTPDGTAVRMWVREWSEETFIANSAMMSLAMPARAEYVARKLVSLAVNVCAQAYATSLFKPSADLLLDNLAINTATGEALDKLAANVGLKRQNTAFSEEPNEELRARIQGRMTSPKFNQLWDDATSGTVLEKPKPRKLTRFEAIVEELKEEDKT